MRKLIVSLITVLMLVLTSTAVFAADSANANDVAASAADAYTNVGSGAVKSSTEILVTSAHEDSNLASMRLSQFTKASSSKALPEGAKLSEFFDISRADGSHGGATVTINCGNNLKGAKQAGLVHVLNGTTTYEVVPGTINSDGTLTVTLNSTSPVAIYYVYSGNALQPVVNTAVR